MHPSCHLDISKPRYSLLGSYEGVGDIWNDDFTLVYGTVEDLGSVAGNPSPKPTINNASMSHFSSDDFSFVFGTF